MSLHVSSSGFNSIGQKQPILQKKHFIYNKGIIYGSGKQVILQYLTYTRISIDQKEKYRSQKKNCKKNQQVPVEKASYGMMQLDGNLQRKHILLHGYENAQWCFGSSGKLQL